MGDHEAGVLPMIPTIKVAVPVPLRGLYDYLPPEGLSGSEIEAGARLLVPFGRRKLVGFAVGGGKVAQDLSPTLKPAIALLDPASLVTEDDCRVLHWASRYYHHPLGEVFAAAFPALLRRGGGTALPSRKVLRATGLGMGSAAISRAPRQALLLDRLRTSPGGIREDDLAALDWDWRAPLRALVRKGLAVLESVPVSGVEAAEARCELPPSLNGAQRNAVDRIAAKLGERGSFLLEGVTGSGKTEVYLRLVQQILERGEQALVLLPEISLTPQLEARFRARIPAPIVLYHSGLNDGQRCRAWLSFRQGAARVMLGTRSAAFAPFHKPGLIIVDEEHDASFKQQEGFRFSARDVAIFRAQQLKIPVVLGSATPSLESLGNAGACRYQRLQLPERAGASVHPGFRVVDIRAQRLQEGLSPPLITQIGETVARGEQVLLFLNRRGFAPTLICHACGWVGKCQRCDANLVMHARAERLSCHHCGYEQSLVRHCPACRCEDLRPLGAGTERVEEALARLYPNTRTCRIDRDTMQRKGSLEQALAEIHAGRTEILLGTQMLAKGHHFPNVTLVGILDVDAGLFSTDFRAGERTAQLIVQVAGRAGREARPGTVVLQTRHPEHPLLQRLISEGYGGFAGVALTERRLAGLPPFAHQVLWRTSALEKQASAELLARLADHARQMAMAGVQVLGPVPAPMPRQAGRYRHQLLLQAGTRKPLHALVDRLLEFTADLPEARRARWSVDVDPIDFY
jgi:primosomal protein N' (replication factor Y) (superfamily II helicase)